MHETKFTKSTEIAASTDTVTSPTAERLNYLDGIRAIAALLVVWHHIFLEVWETQPVPKGDRLMLGWLAYGHFCVDVFIVLSGYVLMLPVLRAGGTLRGGAAVFFRRRARRILPPYYGAVLLSLALIMCTALKYPGGSHWDVSIPVRTPDLIAHLFLVQNLVPHDGYKINHCLWSIAVESQIYVLFPALIWLWKRAGAGATFAVCVLLALAARFLLAKHLAGNGFEPHLLILFVLGMIAAQTVHFLRGVVNRTPEMIAASASPHKAAKASLAGAVLGLLVLVELCRRWSTMGRVNSSAHTLILDILAGVATSLLLIHIGTIDGTLRRLFSVRPLVWIGSFSYSLYLIHAPIIALLYREIRTFSGDSHLLFSWLSLVGLPLVVGLSYAFFLVCERPCLPRSSRAERTVGSRGKAGVLLPAP